MAAAFKSCMIQEPASPILVPTLWAQTAYVQALRAPADGPIDRKTAEAC